MPKSYIGRPYAWRTVMRSLKSRAKQTTVDECLMLSLKELFDRGLVEDGAFHVGSWRWADAGIFQFDGAVRYEADLRNHESIASAAIRSRWRRDGLSRVA
jgi:hypothetical protein